MKPRSAVTILLAMTVCACTPLSAQHTVSEEPIVLASAEGAPPSVDGTLRQAVKRALEADPDLSGALIAVSARDGQVTLAGVVMSPEQRHRAHRITAATRGVRGVDNVLEVEPAR